MGLVSIWNCFCVGVGSRKDLRSVSMSDSWSCTPEGENVVSLQGTIKGLRPHLLLRQYLRIVLVFQYETVGAEHCHLPEFLARAGIQPQRVGLRRF